MSCHEGVSCDNCLKSNFTGKRFKCLICYDYDLCENCHALSVATSRHQASHPMQCILTRHEFEKYYAGESITPESPPSFVCPFCAKLGFTETLLQEHVTKAHEDAHQEVICPVCAALPSGDPNLVTEDLAHHLSMEHRPSRDNDEQTSGRHIRRRGIRTRNHRGMHFSGGPIGSSMGTSSSLLSSNNSSSLRDSMDPITELLSQLSGVRRSAQQLQQNVSTASQLQELQAQLQLERQRAAEIRQQLERFPNKLSTGGTAVQTPNSRTYAEAASTSKTAASSKKQIKTEGDDDKFLLSDLDDTNLSASELEKQIDEDDERSLFVQELLLSLLSKDENDKSILKPSPALEKAVPIQCGLYSATHHKPGSNVTDTLPSHDDSPAKSSVEKSISSGDSSSEKTIPDSRSRPTTARTQQWHYENVREGKESDDEDRAPSPTPLQDGRERLLQSRMYTPGAMSLSGFQDPAILAASFGHEDLAASSVSKHVH